MPAFNAEPHIGRAIESVVSQSFKDFDRFYPNSIKFVLNQKIGKKKKLVAFSILHKVIPFSEW